MKLNFAAFTSLNLAAPYPLEECVERLMRQHEAESSPRIGSQTHTVVELQPGKHAVTFRIGQVSNRHSHLPLGDIRKRSKVYEVQISGTMLPVDRLHTNLHLKFLYDIGAILSFILVPVAILSALVVLMALTDDSIRGIWLVILFGSLGTIASIWTLAQKYRDFINLICHTLTIPRPPSLFYRFLHSEKVQVNRPSPSPTIEFTTDYPLAECMQHLNELQENPGSKAWWYTAVYIKSLSENTAHILLHRVENSTKNYEPVAEVNGFLQQLPDNTTRIYATAHRLNLVRLVVQGLLYTFGSIIGILNTSGAVIVLILLLMLLGIARLYGAYLTWQQKRYLIKIILNKLSPTTPKNADH